jgi:PAS domain S-box-containing protein
MRLDISGADIVAARAKAGLSQADLAKLLGVTQATVSRWEIGTQAPTASLRQKLSLFLDEAKVTRTVAQIVEHSPFNMALMRKDWTIVTVSPRLAEVDGSVAKELRGKSLKDIATAEMERASAIMAERGFFRGTCGPQRIVARGVYTDGRPCAFEAIASPILLDGEIVMLNQIQVLTDQQYAVLRQKFDLVTALE